MDRRPFYLFVSAVAAAALPSVIALGYSKANRDPTLRPLWATAERLAEADSPEKLYEITVLVEWGASSSLLIAPEALKADLNRMLKDYPVNYHIRMVKTAGPQVAISYLVGSNRIGPFPPHRAAEGTNAAIAAFRMGQEARLKLLSN